MNEISRSSGFVQSIELGDLKSFMDEVGNPVNRNEHSFGAVLKVGTSEMDDEWSKDLSANFGINKENTNK